MPAGAACRRTELLQTVTQEIDKVKKRLKIDTACGKMEKMFVGFMIKPQE